MWSMGKRREENDDGQMVVNLRLVINEVMTKRFIDGLHPSFDSWRREYRKSLATKAIKQFNTINDAITSISTFDLSEPQIPSCSHSLEVNALRQVNKVANQ